MEKIEKLYSPDLIKERTISQVSIVVPAFNEEKNIQSFQRSILEQKLLPNIPIQVIISDNGSTDQTVFLAHQFAEVVEGSIPRNISSARKLGIQRALELTNIDPASHLIICTDADGRLNDNYINKVCDFFRKHIDVVASYGPTIYEFSNGLQVQPPDVLMKILRRIIVKNLFFNARVNVKDFFRDEYFFIPGYNMVIRADTYLDLGGFRDSAGGADDLDLSLRLRQKFTKNSIKYNPHQIIYVSGRGYESDKGIFSPSKVLQDLRGKHSTFQGNTTDSEKVVNLFISENI